MSQDASLKSQVEELFIQLLNSIPVLCKFKAKHYRLDEEAETPDIMVKANQRRKLVDHPTDPAKRLYEVDVEFKIRANIEKMEVDEFDAAEGVMERVIGNLKASDVNLLPAANFFNALFVRDMEDSETEDGPKHRKRSRKICFICQQKPA